MVGDRIKKIREIKGYSQEYLANQLNISQSAYYDLENNKTKLGLNRLKKIANILEFMYSRTITFSSAQKKGVTNNAYIINQLSDQLKEQYELRLKEKDKIIDMLKSQLLDKRGSRA